MYHIPVQAMSQNKAFVGKRSKSKEYKVYERTIMTYLSTFQLPTVKNREKFYLFFEAGVPTRQDASNMIKPLEDIISKYIGVDDRHVMAIYCRKVVTRKEDSYIKFNIFTSEHELIEAINTEEI